MFVISLSHWRSTRTWRHGHRPRNAGRGADLEVTDGSVIELTISADYGELPSLSALLSGQQSLPH